MPAMLLVLMGLLLGRRPVQWLLKGMVGFWGLYIFMTSKKYDQLKKVIARGIDPEEEEEIVHVRLDKEDILHPSQERFIGDYILTHSNYLQLIEYMEVDAANAENPGSKWTGIKGEKILRTGKKNFEDPYMQNLIYAAEQT